MKENGPIIIGGNGHSGTRVFAEIVARGGVFTGVRHLTKRKHSEDLKIISLLTRWVRPYVYKTLTAAEARSMKRAFVSRLRLYFPLRSRPWGFKNPRTMLLLPFFDELFPRMRFVHVVRDGRDVSLGNEFVGNAYVDAFLENGEEALSAQEKMILFWGRSNESAMKYGESNMGARYLRIRWEDMCTNPSMKARELLRFAGCSLDQADQIASIVRKPSSLGRWREFPDETRVKVETRGREWLSKFGYA